MTTSVLMSYDCDMGSLKHAENRKNYELAKLGIKQKTQDRRAQVEAKRQAAKAANGGRMPHHLRKIHSKARRIFLRRATADDCPALRDIFNFYIDFTCALTETRRITKMDFEKRLIDINSAELPFIVACEAGEVIKGRKTKYGRADDIIMPDKIIGFALADEYVTADEHGNAAEHGTAHEHGTAEKQGTADEQGTDDEDRTSTDEDRTSTDTPGFTATMEVYVHYQYYMKHVASCLIDKVLAMIDPAYIERGDYELEDEDLDGAAPPTRAVQSIVMTFHYWTAERYAWVTRWLNTAGFREVSHSKGICVKLERSINKVVFERTSGVVLESADLESLDPESPVLDSADLESVASS
jgi:hypothetical protein